MNLVKCANCDREINLKTDAQTFCKECEKDFCFAITSSCFSEYHRKNNINHVALSISDPAWKMKLTKKET